MDTGYVTTYNEVLLQITSLWLHQSFFIPLKPPQSSGFYSDSRLSSCGCSLQFHHPSSTSVAWTRWRHTNRQWARQTHLRTTQRRSVWPPCWTIIRALYPVEKKNKADSRFSAAAINVNHTLVFNWTDKSSIVYVLILEHFPATT